MTLCNSLCVCVCKWEHGLIKGKKIPEQQWGNEKRRERLKKAYVLEVIKRDSVEPAVDLIYTGR